MRKILLLTLMAASVVCRAATDDERAVRRMTERLIPEHAARFSFEQAASSEDSYEIETRKGRVYIKGNSAGSMAVGLNRYLNEYCLTSVSWYADQKVEMPEELPMLPTGICGIACIENRFFLNYCTFGYTMPWWKWTDWERLIDWMALNGVNMPLAITGQEAVWYRVWTNMGLTDSEVRSYFTGPAHLPWHRMSNIDYWQGPLPMEWLVGQEKLQKQIVARERELGMKPILPAFAGHVPKELLRLHPEAKIKSLGSWGGFNEKYMSHYLDPLDPLFAEIQKAFLEEQTRLFGTDHIYGADPFNEVKPPSLEPEFLASCSRETYRSMAAVDPEAVWLQMSWMFSYESHIWTPERVKAFLEVVPQGKMMLLDYYCEKTEVWRMTEKFYGQPYLWCYLGNFGGNIGLAGNAREVEARFMNARKDGGENLAGLGSTLEGFDANRFMYEYVFRMAWDCDEHSHDWMETLADRHLGTADEGMRRAWRVLYDSVYVTPAGLGGGTLLNARPVLTGNGNWTFSNIAYSNRTLFEAWEAMLSAAPEHTRADYEYDVVNVGRQVLGNHFTVLRDQFADAYARGDISALREKGFAMNELLADLDALLSTQSSFLLGKWLADARAMGDEKDYYEENARNIITTWGDRGISLNDYANRTWGGLVKGYYAPRWAEFVDRVIAAASAGETFNAAAFRDWSTQFEIGWVRQHDTYPARPVGNSVEIATALMEKYRPEVAHTELRAEASETVELVYIILALTGEKAFQAPHVMHKEFVDQYFAKYKDHSAVRFIVDEIFKTGAIDMVAPANIGVNSKIVDGRFVYNGNHYGWSAETKAQFVEEVNKFYRETNFDRFWDNVSERLYQQFVDAFNDSVIPRMNIAWLDNYVPVEDHHNYNITLSLMSGAYNFGVAKNGEPNPVVGVWNVDLLLNPTPRTLEAYLPLTMHEYLHPFCNPLIDKYYRELAQAGDAIYPDIREKMTKASYNSWRIVLYEALVRASEIAYMRQDEFLRPVLAAHIAENKNEGFYWIEELGDLMVEYEADRARYPTLDSFMPRVVEFYNALAATCGD